MPKNSILKLIEKGKREKLDEEWGSWVKISYKEQVGYVWSSHISIPSYFIKSNIKKEEAFLYTTKGIYAFKNYKILDFIPVPYQYDEGFYNKGAMSMNSSFQFLTLVMVGEACGQASGEVYYLWDGKKLKHYGSDYGIGDGGFSEVYSLTFPNEDGGIKNRVIEYVEFGETVDYPIELTTGDTYKYFISSQSTRILENKKDTLIEVPSIHSKLRNIIYKNNPEHKLYRYEFGDLNSDGIKDAICIVAKSNNDYETPSKPIILIALGDSKNDFTVSESNNNILKGSTTYDISIKDKKFTINVFYSPYGNYEKNFIAEYLFNYNKVDNIIYWKSKTEVKKTAQDLWDIKTFQFNKKKILFREAWSREMSDNNNEQ